MSTRGRPKDQATDDRIAEVSAELDELGIKPTHSRVALILSWERKDVITPNAVKMRRRYMEQGR